MNYQNKFRICNAIEILGNGDQIPLFSIQRKNIFNIWINVKKRYYKDSYSSENPIITYSKIENAQTDIDEMILRIQNENLVYSKKTIVEKDTIHNVKIRMVKILNKYESGKFERYFFIQKRNMFGLWTYIQENFLSDMESHAVLKRTRYLKILTVYNILKKRIETEKTTKTVSSIINISGE
jgi:hypothetical protein